VKKFTCHSVVIPESVSELFEKKKTSSKMAADYQLFRKELLTVR